MPPARPRRTPAAAPEITIRPCTLRDRSRMVRIWRTCGPGVNVQPDDAPAPLGRFLARNPGMSQVAERGRRMIGAVLVGYDGRRAMIYHLGVLPEERGHGVGTRLLAAAREVLRRTGARKCNLLVHARNRSARRLYARLGWIERTDLVLLQQPLP